MSILQDYEQIKNRIGEEKYKHIEEFLEAHPHYYLSDVFYNKVVWDAMENWTKENK